MEMARIQAIIEFLQGAEKLKDTLRSATTSGGRRESTAEHSWRLCLMVMLFADEMEGIDLLRLLKLCIVHDLGEAISGDIPAISQVPGDDKSGRERRDLVSLCSALPDVLRDEILDLWDEYDAAETEEAQFAKGFDKLETMLQHVIGKNDSDFDYGFNLSYGVEHTERKRLLRRIREAVDGATKREMHIAAGTETDVR